jgi:hypothetical protein
MSEFTICLSCFEVLLSEEERLETGYCHNCQRENDRLTRHYDDNPNK